MPATQTVHEWRATADEIWGVLKETDRIVKENALRQTEIDRIVKENALRQTEIDRIVKENAKHIGELGNRFGEMVEHMILPNLVTKFNEMNLPFTKAYPNVKITDKQHGIYVEADAFLENGDRAVIVETKSKPNVDDIDRHIERMEKVRRYADLHGDKRKYMGAVAGVVFGDEEKDYTLKKGLYVIEPSGETFNITAPAGSPREW